MKIGFDSKRLFCNFTGLGNYSRTLVRNLIEFYAGNDYSLYTTRINETKATRFFIDNPHVRIITPGTSFKSLWRTYSIKNQLKKDAIQLFHGLSNEIPFGLNRTGIKSVVTIHDLIFKRYPGTYQLADRLIYDKKFRYACKNADRIIAISENTKSDISEFYQTDPNKIDIIYQACNPIFYQLQEHSEIEQVMHQYNLPSEYLLSVGSVEPRKNLKKVIESFHYLSKDIKIPMVVIGKGGSYKREVVEMVRKAKLERSIIWIEQLENNNHLQSIYQNAAALIYPSLYEGFGLPVAEALLSKAPVITSERSSMKEAGGPGSLYIDPENAGQIAGAIEKALTDSLFRQVMKEKGHAYAHQKFSPAKVTEQVVSCYERTLSGS